MSNEPEVALGRDEGWLEVLAVPVREVATRTGRAMRSSRACCWSPRGRPLAQCLRLGSAAGAMAVASAHRVARDMTADAVRELAGLYA
jgi:hypothetical protein